MNEHTPTSPLQKAQLQRQFAQEYPDSITVLKDGSVKINMSYHFQWGKEYMEVQLGQGAAKKDVAIWDMFKPDVDVGKDGKWSQTFGPDTSTAKVLRGVKAKQALDAKLPDDAAPKADPAPAPPPPPPAQPAPSGGTPPAPEVPLTEAPEAGTSLLARLGEIAPLVKKAAIPAALLAAPVIEGAEAGVKAHKEGKGPAAVAGQAIKGAGEGVVDTVAPGARSHYSDVTGHNKQLTGLDRTLNGINDASGTVFAAGGIVTVGSTLVGALPVAAVAGTVTTIAAGVNLGDNLIKAGVKASGHAGKDQDGGYIYDGLHLAGQLAAAELQKLHGLVSDSDATHHEAPKALATPATVPSGPQRTGRQ